MSTLSSNIRRYSQATLIAIWFGFYATLDYLNIYTLRLQIPVKGQ